MLRAQQGKQQPKKQMQNTVDLLFSFIVKWQCVIVTDIILVCFLSSWNWIQTGGLLASFCKLWARVFALENKQVNISTWVRKKKRRRVSPGITSTLGDFISHDLHPVPTFGAKAGNFAHSNHFTQFQDTLHCHYLCHPQYYVSFHPYHNFHGQIESSQEEWQHNSF